MSYLPQELVKILPKFRGKYILPENFKFSPTFHNFDFYSLKDPAFFPRQLDQLSKISFVSDFLFSFMTTQDNSQYFIFSNQNIFVLIDLNIFSDVSNTICDIFSKQNETTFIPLHGKEDESKLKILLPTNQFNFTEISKEQKEIINKLFNKLFSTPEIVNYTIFTKIVLEMFSTMIILSNTNQKFNSIQNTLDGDICHEIGKFYESNNNEKDIDIAFRYYLKSIEKGNFNSEVRIGNINEKRGNFEEAIKWYKKSLGRNDSEGQYRLGLLLLPNLDVPMKDILDYLIKSAEDGKNVDSQMLLGDIYNNSKKYSNRQIERNMAKSFKYYLMAAENGNKEAYRLMRRLYKEDKDEVILDTSVEFRYLKLNADNNNSAEEQYELGCIYEDDSITRKDIDKAIYYLEKASDQGHLESRIELALLLKRILKNKSKYDLKSIKSLKNYPNDKLLREKIVGLLSTVSGENGDIKAQYNLGLIYLEEKDFFQARIYFLRAADQGHAESQYQVGLLFTTSEEDKKKYLNRALNYLKEASDNGYSNADVKLGDIYSTKESNYYDMKKAVAFYEKGSNRGNTEAQIKLGNLYKDSNNNPYFNMQKAIECYRSACSNGDPTGLSELGRFYYNGVGDYISQNYQQAHEYLIKAANMNDKYAQYHVGLMKYFGHGCAVDIPESIEWLKSASQHDNDSFTEAMLKLGLIYINELKPPINQYSNQYMTNYGESFINVNESVKWLTKASLKGNSEASNKLGKMYRKGLHVRKDINKAIEAYTIAADRNDQKAIYRLALIYYEGKATTTLDDIDKAVELLQLLARTGHIKARIKLAEIYTRPFPKITANEDIASDHGFSHDKYDVNSTNIYKSKYYTKENIDTAFATLKQFYNADINAKAILGELYYKGIKVKQDVNLALEYLKEAGEAGNADSLLFLGRIYYKGGSIAKDKNMAIKYLTLSAKQNNVKAENKLGKIYFLDGNYNESLFWFTQAAKHGYDVAQYNLGLFYLENRGPQYPKRVESGLHNLEVAATQNYLPALLKLGDYYYKGSHYNNDHFYYNTKISLPNLEYLKGAIAYYKRAADLKSIKAMIKLGEIFERAVDYKFMFDYKESIKIAIYYYEKAFELGFNLYEKSHPKLSKEEIQMLYKDHSYVFPAVKLAIFQRNNEKVKCMDDRKALSILLEARRKGNVAAINFFAKLYLYGNYSKVQIDANKKREEGINLFKSASEMGSKKAKIHLALHYFENHDYQNAFNYFNDVLILVRNQNQNPNSCFDVDFEYDLKDNDYDLYAAFFSQLLAILSSELSINVSKWVINYNDQTLIAKYENENNINSDFYNGLFDFNDFDNDVMHFQYFNNNTFSLDDSIMYKAFMRDSLCITNNYNRFFSKLIEFIELFRHDKDFLANHNNIINKLAKLSYKAGNPKTLLECAILLDDNVVKNNVSNYDCFTQNYNIDLNEVLSANVDNFNHSDFAKSLYGFIMNKIPYTKSVKAHQIAALNWSNYFTGVERFRLIVPYAHNGVKFAIQKILEDFPSFTDIFRNVTVCVEVSEDPEDDFDDFKFQCKYDSIDFNKPDDREEYKSKFSTIKISIISRMKHI